MSSSAEESPAQQAARLRRERREAKIKSGGSARLDKITSLSGRAPSSGKHRSGRIETYSFFFVAHLLTEPGIESRP
jgi:hypothetical protein